MQFEKPEEQVQLNDNTHQFLYNNVSFKCLRADRQEFAYP